MKTIKNLTGLLTEIAYQLKRVANGFAEQSKILEEINTHRH